MTLAIGCAMVGEFHRHRPMAYRIETRTNDGWSSDPSLLGPGITDAENTWRDRRAAVACIRELCTVGFRASDLRAVEID